LNVAKEEAVKLVSDHNPYVWTNLLRPEPGDVVDFSVPGRHHSWEEVNEITRKLFREAGFKDQLYDDFKVNRLDEIQTGLYVDLEGRYTETSSVSIDEFKTLSLCEKRKCVVVLTDDNSSIRAFDKGKFRTDGALRPLDIDSYFKFISRENDLNLSNAVVKPQVSDLSDGTVSKYIFATDKYAFTVIDTSKQNDESVFEKSFSGEFCDTSDSYHHIYVDAGPVILTFERGHDPITVNEGYSVFLSSTFGRYGINPTGSCKNARISISYVPGST